MNITERPAWQQRLLKEREELQDKLTKLAHFLASSTVTLSPKIRKLRQEQLVHMKHYLDTLDAIIEEYNEAA